MDLQKTAEWLKSMSPETFKNIKDTFNNFNRLKSICVGKGWVTIDKSLSTIHVIENHPEVKELHDVFIKVQPQGVKFIDKNGKILFDHPIDKAPRRGKNK